MILERILWSLYLVSWTLVSAYLLGILWGVMVG